MLLLWLFFVQPCCLPSSSFLPPPLHFASLIPCRGGTWLGIVEKCHLSWALIPSSSALLLLLPSHPGPNLEPMSIVHNACPSIVQYNTYLLRETSTSPSPSISLCLFTHNHHTYSDLCARWLACSLARSINPNAVRPSFRPGEHVRKEELLKE